MTRSWKTAVALVATALPLLSALPACSRTANVTDVFTALDGDGLRKRERFTTDSKGAFCVVEYTISRPGATLEVFIRQRQLADGSETNRVLAAVEESPAPSEASQKASVPLLALDDKGQPDDGAPIPPGSFRCEVLLDGVLGGFAEFKVDFADCPPAQITDRTECAGFFQPEKVCPRYGASSTDKTTCKCTGGAWLCDK